MGSERTLFLPLLRPLGFRCIRTEGLALFTHLREGLFCEVSVASVRPLRWACRGELASLGYYPDFLIIPSRWKLRHGDPRVGRTGAMRLVGGLRLAPGSRPAGPLGPRARLLRDSSPSRRSAPPPCRPDAAKRARPGRLRGRGGSLRADRVFRVSVPLLGVRYPRPFGSTSRPARDT